MAQVLNHNAAAQISLGELNKNISKLGQAIAKVSSGMKINGAKDDSAQFAISEVMRVKIRALEQDIQNVQNGMTMVRTAEAGIQEQIDIMRSIKEKVINAANDHNTDADRKILQKEVSQLYDQVEQVAEYTDYNKRRLLVANTSSNEKTVEWDDVIPNGNYVGKRVTAWIPNLTDENKAKIVQGSDSLNLIDKNNIVDTDLAYLSDGRPYVENGGPFDTFTKVTAVTSKTLQSLGNIKTNSAAYFTGGSDGVDKIISMDLSGYNSVSELDGLAFTVTYPSNNLTTDVKNYVLSTDTSKNYASTSVTTNSVVVPQLSGAESSYYTPSGGTINLQQYTYSTYQVQNEIDISGCNTFDDVAAKLKTTLSNAFGNVAVSATDPNKIEFTSKNPNGFASDTINTRTTIKGFSATGGSISITSADGDKIKYIHQNAPKTISSLSTISVTLSGGKNAGGEVAGQKASGSANITADADKLYYINGSWIKFVEGSDIKTTSVSIKDAPFNVGDSDMVKGTPPRTLTDKQINITEVGINSSWSTSYNSCTWKMNNGKIDVTANYVGTSYNTLRTLGSTSTILYFDYTTEENVEPGIDSYVSTVAAQTQDKQQAGNGTFAHYDIDFSNYVGNHNADDLEDVIEELKDITLTFTTNKSSYGSYLVKTYSFTDSLILNDLTAPGYYRFDLNDLRTSVESGSDIATALQNLFSSATDKAIDNQTPRFEKISNGIRVNAYDFGKELDTLSDVHEKGYFYTAIRGNNYYTYTLDFKKLFESNPNLKMSDLYGKGFMAYCATCPSPEQPDPQWFNFFFTDNNLPPPISVPKPEIDTDEDIRDIPINISKLEDGDYSGLVQAIYDQASTELNNINHHMFIAGDKRNGTVTLYESYSGSSDYSTFSDVRKAANGTLYGAIIMDGYKDTSIPVTEDYYEDRTDHNILQTADRDNRLIIHHTDKSSQHITVHIPPTTLKDIFQDWRVENHEIRDIRQLNLASKKDRNILLGDDKKQGAIDAALDYLIDAATQIGAQIAAMEYTENNVVTMSENTQAAESTIRDADMAKEMSEYTKANVLTQAAQSMLAQANQSSSSILDLLQ